MRIEQLIKLQQQQQTITKMETTDESEEQHLNIVDEDGTEEDEEDLPAQFKRNVFLPPLGSPASPQVAQLPSTNCHPPPQPTPFPPLACPTSTPQMAAVQALWLQQAASAAAAALAPMMPAAPTAVFSSGFPSTASLQSAAPTAENFLHFMQLAHTFGFQLDFGHKMLHFAPGTFPSPHSPVGIGTAPPITSCHQQQPAEQGQLKGKRKEAKSSQSIVALSPSPRSPPPQSVAHCPEDPTHCAAVDCLNPRAGGGNSSPSDNNKKQLGRENDDDDAKRGEEFSHSQHRWRQFFRLIHSTTADRARGHSSGVLCCRIPKGLAAQQLVGDSHQQQQPKATIQETDWGGPVSSLGALAT